MAEDFESSWHDLKSESGPDPFLQSGYRTKDGYLVIKREAIRGPGGFRFFMESRDEDFNLQEVRDFSKEIDENQFYVHGFYKMKDQFMVLTVEYNRADKSKNLYAQTFDPESMSLSERKEIFNRSYEGRVIKWGGFSVNLSRNREHMVVSYTERDEADDLVINYTMLDKEGEIQTTREKIRYPKSDHDFYLNDIVVSDKGQVYFLMRKSERVPKERGVKKDVKISYAILRGDVDGGDFREIVQEGLSFERLYLNFTQTGELFLSGYYRTESGKSIDGSMLLKIDPESGEVLHTSKDEFSKEFITEGMSDRSAGKVEKREEKGEDVGIYNLYPLSYVSHDDGSFSVVGEIFYVTVTTTTNANGGTTTRYHYHYNDLIISRYNREGELLHQNKIVKRETYSSERPGEIIFNHNNDVLFVAAMNSPQFIEGFAELPKADKKAKDGHLLVAYRVHDDGTETTEGLVDCTGERRGYRRFSVGIDCVLLDTHELLARTYYGRKMFGIALVKPK